MPPTRSAFYGRGKTLATKHRISAGIDLGCLRLVDTKWNENKTRGSTGSGSYLLAGTLGMRLICAGKCGGRLRLNQSLRIVARAGLEMDQTSREFVAAPHDLIYLIIGT